MEFLVPTTKLIDAKKDFKRMRLHRLQGLYIKLMVGFIINGVFLFFAFKQPIEGVKIQSFFSHFEMPILWGFCMIIQFSLYYSHKLPLLRQWEQKQISKYVKRYTRSLKIQYTTLQNKD